MYLHSGRPAADHVFAGRPHETAEAAAGEGESVRGACAHVRVRTRVHVRVRVGAHTHSEARLACGARPSYEASLSSGMSPGE